MTPEGSEQHRRQGEEMLAQITALEAQQAALARAMKDQEDRKDEERAAFENRRCEIALAYYDALVEVVTQQREYHGPLFYPALEQLVKSGAISVEVAGAMLAVAGGVSKGEFVERGMDVGLWSRTRGGLPINPTTRRPGQRCDAGATDLAQDAPSANPQGAGDVADVADVAELQQARDRIRDALRTTGPLADGLQELTTLGQVMEITGRIFHVATYEGANEALRRFGIAILTRGLDAVGAIYNPPELTNMRQLIAAIHFGLSVKTYLKLQPRDQAALQQWIDEHRSPNADDGSGTNER